MVISSGFLIWRMRKFGKNSWQSDRSRCWCCAGFVRVFYLLTACRLFSNWTTFNHDGLCRLVVPGEREEQKKCSECCENVKHKIFLKGDFSWRLCRASLLGRQATFLWSMLWRLRFQKTYADSRLQFGRRARPVCRMRFVPG